MNRGKTKGWRKLPALLRLVLLLTVTAAGEAWGQSFTGATYYEQDYESETTANGWSTSTSDRYTPVILDEDGNRYLSVNQKQRYNNGCSVTGTSLAGTVAAGRGFIMTFDLKVSSSNDQSPTSFRINDASNNGIIFSLTANGSMTTAWKINGGETTYTLPNTDKYTTSSASYSITDVPWYTVIIKYYVTDTYVTIKPKAGGNAICTDEHVSASATGGLGKMVFTTSRYYSNFAIDNIKVYKWGWDTVLFQAALTDADTDNKIASSPTLYNPEGAAVSYSYDGTVLGTLDGVKYPPRLKTTGDGTVTATVGERTSSYTYRVTAPAGGGTYDAATKTYTFDRAGVVDPYFQVTAVPGISMTLGEPDGSGNPTSVVVSHGGQLVLKAIDGNGYSHPNLNYGQVVGKIPARGINGGTYYVFRPSAAGELTVSGQLSNATLYQYNGSDEPEQPVVEPTTGSSLQAHLETGNTYYLYNGKVGVDDNAVPLLHAFTYVPTATSLVFRNAQSVVTVDVGEGRYTNPALSAAGLPVTYSVLSGPGTVDAAGTVTFTGDYFVNPQPISVIASAGTESASYTINLVKRTWIFDQEQYWTTTAGELGALWQEDTWNGYYRDGSRYYRDADNRHFNWETLKIPDGQDDTKDLPETRGLLFNDNQKNNRIIITPRGDGGISKYYLGLTSTFVGIDNMKTDQTVTVDWYATRSDAILNAQDAAGEVTDRRGRSGVTVHTVSADGRVTLTTNGSTTYIRSIRLSTPTRAVGQLTYAKGVLHTGETLARQGYVITDEGGTQNLRDAYSGPGSFQSSNPAVVSVDASGQLTAQGVGTAVISATATARNSGTHQATVTLVALVEVVDDAAMRIRTIYVDDLLYTAGAGGAALNRTIPGFTLSYTGAATSAASAVTLGAEATMTVSPRPRQGEAVTISGVQVTVQSATSGAEWTVGGVDAPASTGGGYAFAATALTGSSLTLAVTAGAVTVTAVKVYYTCGNADNADYCLVETKEAPAFTFAAPHLMRVPADGVAFAQEPVLSATNGGGANFGAFAADYTYASSAPAIATIAADGTGGQLLGSGEATISATFHETAYFAQATAHYRVSNTLLPGETYDRGGAGVAVGSGQHIHIQALATAAGTPLTLTATTGTLAATALTYGTTAERRNTYATEAATVSLENRGGVPITVNWVHVVTPRPLAWLYYKGQEENYKEQVQYLGFATGAVAGFRVLDIGAPDTPIDLTDAYSLKDDAYYELSDDVSDPGVLTLNNASTGEAQARAAGTVTISHLLTKTGTADGYADDITASALVNVRDFGGDADREVTWQFVGTVTAADRQLGDGWTYDDRGFLYGYFADYAPVLSYTAPEENRAVLDAMHGMLLKDEYRWYPGRGLRANLSQPKATLKFPVKAGMEIDVYAASSSADVTHTISNVTDLAGHPTTTLYIQQEGEANPIHNIYIAREDGCVEIHSTDKVGMYLKSITLRVPRIHFTDDVVTVLPTGDGYTGTVTNTAVNVPAGSRQYLEYTVTAPATFVAADGETVTPATLVSNADDKTGALSNATDATRGRLTLTGREGYFTVEVENTNPSPTSVEPRSGSYRVYVVDFRFDPDAVALTLSDGEASYDVRPAGYDRVPTAIDYGYTIPDGSTARARIRQQTNTDPALTTYLLSAYSVGDVVLTATTGRITTACTLTVGGYSFEQVAPVLSDKDIAALKDGAFYNKLPAGFNVNDYEADFAADLVGDITKHPTYAIVPHDDGYAVKITDLRGIGHGAIRFTATDTKGTATTSDDETIQFVLTLAYPAKSKKKWDFYKLKDGLSSQKAHDDKIGDYEGTHADAQTVSDYVITGTNTWQTSTTWNKIYRNGDKEPRWAYSRSMKCDNAFVIEETAGLQIETPPNGFYVDNNTTAAYTHIGLHSRSTVTIPRLRNGDLVSLNMSRVIPNNGAIIAATNVSDLAGTPVTEQFTITRSQIDYRENGALATDADGARIIPGYYTFIAHKEGAAADDEFDVSFTLSDEGYLDLLGVEVYAPDSYADADPANGYHHTMTRVKLNTSGYPYAPLTLLKEDAEQEVYGLSFCHPMWSTSVGPASYVLRGTTANLDATLDNIGWYSAGGAYYEDGRITVNRGYGKITVRMNNYTAEGRYLIGYTPDYTLTVGHRPHQDYPYTWDFTNISGGEVRGQSNNAYNSVSGDAATWTALGDSNFRLNTDTEGGSYYVPGATLVTTARDLGERTATALEDPTLGYDELNGLGFSGQLMFRTEAPANARRQTVATRADGANTTPLLEYTMSDANYADTTALTAGAGTIYFGYDKREPRAEAACGYGYKLDGDVNAAGTGTKYIRLTPGSVLQEGNVLLTPGSALQEGDVLQFKVFCTSTPHGNDFGISLHGSLSATTPLATLYIPEGVAKNTETTVSYTVSATDGLKGLTSLYVFRAAGKSTYVSEVAVSRVAGLASKRLYTLAPTTITIPDLNAGGRQDWIYVKSSSAPTAVSNATAVTADGPDGPDAAPGVYKYKVTAPGPAEVTFAGATEVEQIGVTHILKTMTKAGTDAWATEGRDHAIDHSLTGLFTVNPVTANTVTVAQYATDRSRTVVRLNTIAPDGYVPAATGLVMKLDGVASADGTVVSGGGFTKTNSFTTGADATGRDATGRVPLFYPAVSRGQTSASVSFPSANMMWPRLEDGPFAFDWQDVNGRRYNRFILAKRYATWVKREDDLTVPTAAEWRDAAVFYRMHHFSDGDAALTDGRFDSQTPAELNNIGLNKAYLLLPLENINDAVWNGTAGSRRQLVGILGVSDMADDDLLPAAPAAPRTYDLGGRRVSGSDDTLRPGVYIRGGRKIIVK